MGDRVELPGGAWCELRDPRAVTERQRRPVKQAMFAISRDKDRLAAVSGGDTSGLTDEVIAGFDTLNDQVAVALIAAWSFEQPVTVDGLQDLPGDVYDAIQAAVAPHVLELMPNFGVDGVADPKAATTS